MGIPVRRFEKGYEGSGTAEDRMKSKALEKTMEGVRSTLGELSSKTVAAYVFCICSVESQ